MKIKHRINPNWQPKVVIDDAYQAEIDATMRRAEQAWKQAVRAAERAEARVLRRPAELKLRADASELRQAAEARWKELKAYERLMQAAVTGVHRSGKGSASRVNNKGTL